MFSAVDSVRLDCHVSNRICRSRPKKERDGANRSHESRDLDSETLQLFPSMKYDDNNTA